ncbi:MAG TPA: chemotaxis response regulator protein-glutamate methylesterase [Clostridia bacterium]|nr:chemotaxis response regulator protein-glutamate methylesterase [Clostridia bacterium]
MNRIKVLVVDDSVFMQRVIKRALEKNEKTEVAAVAGDGLQALEILKKRDIDVVTMDIRMPRMDGFEALKAIMDTKPVPVIMISSYTKKGVEDTIRYLETGAVDFITKPSPSRVNDLERFERELNLKIAIASTARLIGLMPVKRPVIQLPGREIAHDRVLRHVIAIGCSTGGPKALQQVLQVIPGSIDCAVLVVQHMPPGFTGSLAERLEAICQLKVKEAQHNETVRAGYCYIAPGDYHMRVSKGSEEGIKITLDKGNAVSGHRPSVDALFESLGDIEAEKVVAVILTGMGSDGSRGIVKLKQKRDCIAIAQDRDTSIVFGMPGSAIKTGFVDKVTALGDIGEEILKSLEVL